MNRPLEGVRVLDLSRLLPGPFASLVLADLGAEVDKVEDPHGGDYLRHMPPQIGDQNAAFLALNRGKRSIVLDLKHADGRATLERMLPRYDVVLEQFRPGVMDRLGLGHQALREKFPRLVIAAITGYGQSGPLSQRAGHDIDYLARGGLLGLTGPIDRAPQPPGFQLADVSGGLWAVIGILAALRGRESSGQGAVIDISMTESAIPFAMIQLGNLFAGLPLRRGGEGLTGGIVPFGTYATKDGGAVALGALEPKLWRAFCEGVGLEFDMAALMPGPHQEPLRDRVAALFASRTRSEWVEFSERVDCCLEPVLTPEELPSDAQHRARGLFVEQHTPFGKSMQLRLPVGAPREEPPPAMGGQTDEILRDAGLVQEEIDKLRASGAVR